MRPTTLAQKQTFLRKKGLTENEIEAACQKAGVYGDLENNVCNYIVQYKL